MEKHLTILGVLYIAMGVIGLIVAFIAFVAIVGGGAISGDEQAIAITGTVGTVIAFLLVLISLPAVIAGIGLVRHLPWARVVALVLAVLNVLNIPFGTALAVYTFWVLMKPETQPLFESSPAARQPT